MKRSGAMVGALVVLGAGGVCVAGPGVGWSTTVPGGFTDISGTGTPLGLGDDDEVAIISPVGNLVFPAGRVVIGNNGGIGFGEPPVLPSDDLSPMNAPLPSTLAFGGGKSLLGYWDDIGNKKGDVYWQVMGGTLIVQWEDRDLNNPDRPAITFQVKVIGSPGPNQAFAQFIYADIEGEGSFGGASATIGYQDAFDPEFPTVQFSFNQQLAVRNGTVLSLVLIPTPGAMGMVGLGLMMGMRRGRRG